MVDIGDDDDDDDYDDDDDDEKKLSRKIFSLIDFVHESE